MADLEANLLQVLNIPADDAPSKAYGSRQSNSRGGAAASGSAGTSRVG